MAEKDFILASGSPQRKRLLEQLGYIPNLIEPADIDETPYQNEKASAYVKRMASEKARHIADKHPGRIVLACDTVVVAGAKIIQKAHNDKEQEAVMRILSGKTHRVLSAVSVIDKQGRQAVRLNVTKIKMKHLSEKEIKDYVAGHDWIGCSGYRSEGVMEAFIRKIVGSTSGVIGLPLYETKNMLNSAGIH